MGGMGSGASRFRRIAEECKRIDIREWQRRGYLRGSCQFGWRWTCGEEITGSITVTTEPREIRLHYTITGDMPEAVLERIRLDIRPCRFGGERKYFTCPRCARNAEILYMARGRFSCRKCARIGYAIENLEKQWRADRQFRKLEMRLNEDGSKPPRMRWKTFENLCAQLEFYDRVSLSGLEKLVARLGRI